MLVQFSAALLEYRVGLRYLERKIGLSRELRMVLEPHVDKDMLSFTLSSIQETVGDGFSPPQSAAKTPLASESDVAGDEHVGVLMEMFPDQSADAVRLALRDAGGDLNRAVGLLFERPPVHAQAHAAPVAGVVSPMGAPSVVRTPDIMVDALQLLDDKTDLDREMRERILSAQYEDEYDDALDDAADVKVADNEGLTESDSEEDETVAVEGGAPAAELASGAGVGLGGGFRGRGSWQPQVLLGRRRTSVPCSPSRGVCAVQLWGCTWWAPRPRPVRGCPAQSAAQGPVRRRVVPPLVVLTSPRLSTETRLHLRTTTARPPLSASAARVSASSRTLCTR
jgi:hypothetical protein